MRRATIALLFGVALSAACLQRIDSRPTPQDEIAVNNCAARVSTPWRPLSGVEFIVIAQSDGPDCHRAAVTLSIRDGAGGLLWTESRAAEHVMTLAGLNTSEEMRSALAEWIAPEGNTTMATTSALPVWPEGADAPQSGEFPFYPEPDFDRDAYEALREANTPLYCFVQGMESMACLTPSDGQFRKVGVQLFPG